MGLGRYIPRAQRVAERTDLNAIVATGLHTYDELPHQYEHRGPGLLPDLPSDPMIDDFTHDLTEAIAGTRIKTTFLKGVVEAKRLALGMERNLRCSATHGPTGAPITVHTAVGNTVGLLALSVFSDECVDSTKVVIGHAGDSKDLDYLSGMAEAGRLPTMDHFGLDIYNPRRSRPGWECRRRPARRRGPA